MICTVIAYDSNSLSDRHFIMIKKNVYAQRLRLFLQTRSQPAICWGWHAAAVRLVLLNIDNGKTYFAVTHAVPSSRRHNMPFAGAGSPWSAVHRVLLITLFVL